jgi:lipopolysaccharide transport system ATP-binding protein
MEPIISVRGLGKSYRIQTGERKPYRTLRDDIADFGKCLLKGKLGNSRTEEFWALKDIDLDIYPGEVVGIIGRNGAGKSTLLKILSRVIQPTKGEAILKGRIASLLEVGTGFHPELTGRENIFMSGAILGMNHFDIKNKFDEIVAFAELDKFLDTPVKRYSSGMYVRLAFGVAAHLEPEILIVDEVLAVGDAAFQKKCIGKMEETAKNGGRTILFVSHNIAAIYRLCGRGILLKNGEVMLDDNISTVTKKYILEGSQGKSGNKLLDQKNRGKGFKVRDFHLSSSEKIQTNCFSIEEPVSINFEYKVNNSFPDLEITIRIYNSSGIPIFSLNRSATKSESLNPGIYTAHIEIPQLFLVPDSYSIDLSAHIPNIEVIYEYKSIDNFEIEETGSNMSFYHGHDFGVILLNLPWNETTKSL